jgi:uncharacterized membrane protein
MKLQNLNNNLHAWMVIFFTYAMVNLTLYGEIGLILISFAYKIEKEVGYPLVNTCEYLSHYGEIMVAVHICWIVFILWFWYSNREEMDEQFDNWIEQRKNRKKGGNQNGNTK